MTSPIAGTRLRPGTFRISPADDATLREVLGSTVRPDGEPPHPLWGYLAPQRGIGTGVAELCAIADFDVADGPMLGSTDIEYFRDLRADVEYAVEGEVVDMIRKSGRALGSFDLFTYRERLLEPDGTVAVQVTNTFVLRRPAEPA